MGGVRLLRGWGHPHIPGDSGDCFRVGETEIRGYYSLHSPLWQSGKVLEEAAGDGSGSPAPPGKDRRTASQTPGASHWFLLWPPLLFLAPGSAGGTLSSSGVCNAPASGPAALPAVPVQRGLGPGSGSRARTSPVGPQAPAVEIALTQPSPFPGVPAQQSIVGPLAAARSFTGRHGPHGCRLPARNSPIWCGWSMAEPPVSSSPGSGEHGPPT